MATKTRDELKAFFKNGYIPTEQNFVDLIDSALVRRSDRLFGKWIPNTAYHHGDVVLYDHSLYELEWFGATPTSTPSSEPYCHNDPPPQDAVHWKKLRFDLQDEDWRIVPNKNGRDGYLVAFREEYQVGIGPAENQQPEARLDVREKERGSLQFNPEDTPPDGKGRKYAELRLSALDYPDCVAQPRLVLRVDDELAQLMTNTRRGFLLQHDHPVDQIDAPRPLLAVIDHHPGAASEPRVGIGTADPKATLDARLQESGKLEAGADHDNNPELRLLRRNGSFLAQRVGEKFATFRTDAPRGFRFQPFAGHTGYDHGATVSAVVIDEQGHLGVGTPDPVTHLEVKKPDCGAFQVCLNEINPAVVLLNLKPNAGKDQGRQKPYNNYFTTGADNSFAVLKTDAPCGFVFKREVMGDGKNAPECNVNTGDKHFYIDQDGKVGIGMAPEEYDLDVRGQTRNYGTFVAHNSDTIDCIGNLEKGVEIICQLKPVRYTWKNTLGGRLDDQKEGFALVDYVCADAVPQIVKTIDNGENALDYQGLVPVLVRAIQQQQDMINRLNNDINELENKMK